MLVGEPRKRYYIYPSCCCFQYSFDELRTVLADPIGCSALSEGVDYYQSLNFPLDVQPFDMLPSQHGGGIVVAHAAMEPNERWLPEEVLLSRAGGSTPHGMEAFRFSDVGRTFPAHVLVLQPEGDPFAEYPTRDGRRFQSCYATLENADSCADETYWVVEVKPGKAANRILESIPEAAREFDLDLDRVVDVPQALQEETREWFVDATFHREWYRVSNASQRVGLNFAIIVFCGLHFRNLAGGSCLRAVHLLASIEGRPNVRNVFWHKTRR